MLTVLQPLKHVLVIFALAIGLTLALASPQDQIRPAPLKLVPKSVGNQSFFIKLIDDDRLLSTTFPGNVAGGDTQVVKMFDTRSGIEINSYSYMPDDSNASFFIPGRKDAFAISYDRKLFAVPASARGSLTVHSSFDVSRVVRVHPLDNQNEWTNIVLAPEFCNNDKYLFYWRFTDLVIYDILAGKEVFTYSGSTDANRAQSPVTNPRTSKVVFPKGDHKLYMLDAKTFLIKDLGINDSFSDGYLYNGYKSYLSNSDVIYTLKNGGELVALNLKSGELVTANDVYTALDYNFHANRLFAAKAGKIVELDLVSLKPISTVDISSQLSNIVVGQMNRLTVSPSCRTAAIATYAGLVTVDLTTRKIRSVISGYGSIQTGVYEYLSATNVFGPGSAWDDSTSSRVSSGALQRSKSIGTWNVGNGRSTSWFPTLESDSIIGLSLNRSFYASLGGQVSHLSAENAMNQPVLVETEEIPSGAIVWSGRNGGLVYRGREGAAVFRGSRGDTLLSSDLTDKDSIGRIFKFSISDSLRRVAGVVGRVLYVWDTSDGSLVQKVDVSKQYGDPVPPGLISDNEFSYAPFYDCSFIPQSDTELSVLESGKILEISVADGAVKRKSYIKPASQENPHDNEYLSFGRYGDHLYVIERRDFTGAIVKDVVTSEVLARVPADIRDGHRGKVLNVSFDPDGRFFISVDFQCAKVWDRRSGDLLYTRYSYPNGKWVALAPDGRFDSSEGAFPDNGNYVLYGKTTDVLDHEQLSSSPLHVPDLVLKIVDGSYVAKSTQFTQIVLPPLVSQEQTGGSVQFRVQSNGGGIGQTHVFVNGHLVKTYGRGEIQSGQLYAFSFPDYRFNVPIEVVSYDSSGLVSSRRVGDNEPAQSPGDDTPVRVVGVFVGAENYTGQELRPLNFAGNDARALSNAVSSIAKNSGIEPEIYLLTDDQVIDESLANSRVARSDWDEAVSKIAASELTPNDILVVYMAGHGISVDPRSGPFCFVLPDSPEGKREFFTNAENRDKYAVTTSDINFLLSKAIYAKRVLIIDTCDAGQFVLDPKITVTGQGTSGHVTEVRSAVGLMSRETRSTRVLLSCPSGAKSYEVSSLGHSLLNYSMLETLAGRNVSMGSIPDTVQVGLFLEVSASRTRQLATYDFGLEQDPITFGQSDFVLGVLNQSVRESIPAQLNQKIITSVRILDENGEQITELQHKLANTLKVKVSTNARQVRFVDLPQAVVGSRIVGRRVGGDASELVEVSLITGFGKSALRVDLGEYNLKSTEELDRLASAIENAIGSSGE